eukprot:CAMPEP_0170577268 /NCGR_PEP_ID=MMETSP0224-20130122/4836_1 /TAXON_ID=285029 /ORGANISM="Togula jolla, Strain CCCM 725" /LENGTH=114 /DNA_ID=CAMNT_0010900167 /DNA_START=513 /DNA_END=855 /DNA_ORIENTATION=-
MESLPAPLIVLRLESDVVVPSDHDLALRRVSFEPGGETLDLLQLSAHREVARVEQDVCLDDVPRRYPVQAAVRVAEADNPGPALGFASPLGSSTTRMPASSITTRLFVRGSAAR